MMSIIFFLFLGSGFFLVYVIRGSGQEILCPITTPVQCPVLNQTNRTQVCPIVPGPSNLTLEAHIIANATSQSLLGSGIATGIIVAKIRIVIASQSFGVAIQQAINQGTLKWTSISLSGSDAFKTLPSEVKADLT